MYIDSEQLLHAVLHSVHCLAQMRKQYYYYVTSFIFVCTYLCLLFYCIVGLGFHGPCEGWNYGKSAAGKPKKSLGIWGLEGQFCIF